jgi:hypothetical protein
MAAAIMQLLSVKLSKDTCHASLAVSALIITIVQLVYSKSFYQQKPRFPGVRAAPTILLKDVWLL